MKLPNKLPTVPECMTDEGALTRRGEESPLLVTLRLINKLRKINPRPICAKCGKIVDEFELETTGDDCFFHFTASCHGARQRFSIHKGYILLGEEFEIGQAFLDGMPVLIDYILEIDHK